MELYNNPANRFVAGFIGSPAMNFLPAETLGGAAGEVVGVRPEYLRIGATGRITGRVALVERLGGDTNILVDVGAEDPVTVRAFGQVEIDTDTDLTLDFDDADSFRFGKDGQRL